MFFQSWENCFGIVRGNKNELQNCQLSAEDIVTYKIWLQIVQTIQFKFSIYSYIDSRLKGVIEFYWKLNHWKGHSKGPVYRTEKKQVRLSVLGYCYFNESEYYSNKVYLKLRKLIVHRRVPALNRNDIIYIDMVNCILNSTFYDLFLWTKSIRSFLLMRLIHR